MKSNPLSTVTNPLRASFVGAASCAFVAALSAAQFDICLDQAHAQMQTPEFQAAVAADTGDFWSFDPDSYMARLRPYVVKDGILQIPIKGALLHDYSYALPWATGYDYIWRAYQRGMGDLNVKGIALVVDSCGGMVAGNFDCVDRMWSLKGKKPVRGYASEVAYSAAYSIISVSDSITISRTGGAGSIGVVTGHLDVSGAMKKAGLVFTYVSAPEGGHKTDGNPYQALSKDAQTRMQERINELYDVFVSTVARNRGMDEQAVRETEALTFTAQQALSNGLVDSIGALDDALAEYAADLTPSEGDEDMSTTTDGTVAMAAQETAVAEARTQGHVAGTTAGHGVGLAEGALAERARISAIIGSEEGKARPNAALAAALDTDLSADQASAFLAKLAKETPTAAVVAATKSPDALAAAMDATGGGAGVGVGTGDAAAVDPDDASSAIAAAHAFGIAGMKPPVAK